MSVERTLGNKDWLNQNEAHLRQLFPETWTHISRLNNIGIVYHLKLMGVEWHGDDLALLMNFFLETGVVIQQDQQFKRGKNHIEFEKVYSPKKGKAVSDKDTKEKVNAVLAPIDSILKTIVWAAMGFGWIGGFVLAKGFWSTVCCIMPFWAWYLMIEKVLQNWGWV